MKRTVSSIGVSGHQENPEIHMWAYGAYKPPLISCVVAEIYLGYMSYC